ncbi:hypothetical protein F4824DRAFT_424617 [Ustulina deusta]|nr:hypothetical protein F4824DRAFT_424617 [Ustulina deusta]
MNTMMEPVDCRCVDTCCAPYRFLTWLLLALFLSSVVLIIGDWMLFLHTGKSCQERAAPEWALDHARRRRHEHPASSSAAGQHGRYNSPRPRHRSPGRAPGYTPPRQTIRLSASGKMAPSNGVRRETA